MIELIKHVADVIQGKAKLGKRRSSEWPKVRKAHLVTHPACEVCGSKVKLQCHHKLPYHLHPDLELDPTNLITLCEGPSECHLTFGHLRSFKSFNKDVEVDAKIWNDKLKGRP